MKNNLIVLLFMLVVSFTLAQSDQVSVVKSDDGFRLTVNGENMIINGMNWDYVPIGTTITDTGIWGRSDDIIKAALDEEMLLLKNMGVNAIRTYGLEPKWIQYIYENYGIYTMLNITFGAYGLTINGAWTPQTDYADEATREILMQEAIDMANTYKNTPGLLLYMIGNENNYHLSWTGAETEAIPIDGAEDTNKIAAARALYKAFNDAAKEVKSIDQSHPIAICNGDLLYLDLVKQECTDIDIYGTNMYRGVSFGDAFQRVNDELDMPILFAEFGSDAFNAKDNKEDQYMQAYFDVENWKDIYQNAAGLGKAGNSLGGFTFQFSDGWWKFGQTKNLDVHDNNASWPNGGYYMDLEPGQNNMNEEWFGICAKGQTDSRGLYTLYPRAAYYALKEVHQFDPYAEGVNQDFLYNYFKNINVMDAVLRARGDKAALGGGDAEKLSISRLSAQFTTFNTGGSLITTPDTEDPNANVFPNQLGFDHMQSYFVGIQGKPAANMRANVEFNILGNVAENPINEIFYENVGRPITVVGVEGGNNIDAEIADFNRLRVYQAEFEWKAKDFDLRGFYRTGHYHWAYEGDFFNLYPEANYGPNLDIYNGEILGIEVDAKGELEGLKAAFGPQLWWGANPTMLLKYSRNILNWDVTGIYHRDLNTDLEFDENGRRVLNPNQVRSGIIPPWPTERATLAIERDFGSFGVTLGGIWGGNPLNGSSFQMYDENNDVVVVDQVNSQDNWGAKAKVTYQKGRFNWYAQGSYMGLVANGGADQTRTFTGWRLKDSGSGNMTNFLSGFTYSFGNLQVAPNFMWQKPLVDPMPNGVPAPGRLRNVIDDPFAVRGGNRETTAGEILFTFDPTPGTWMYEWNNDREEDAKFAVSAGFVYRYLPTTQDAHIGFLANRTFFAFSESAPAEDLWEAHTRIVSKLSPELGIIGNFYYGNGQGNGDSDRTITRFGGDLRMLYKNFKVMSHVKVNDWGPFDYHRDFNLTFPLQLMLDVSTTLGKPDWFILPSTQVGIRGTWRSLDQNSPRYSPLATDPNSTNPNSPPTLSPVGFPDGTEWEIRTYIHINIGK
ncbi:glycoside hydrolase family 2 TIM barrel-domain containing protein [Winogradskyella aquimaris]|uniref:Glycoside hydrolase family 2 TIM barrel-domain containing protein n=1 Tax=Winogradskyella aquimaris TaxID=864074 RepID=A0ABU5EIJ9_9FLAO|nr:glycoside hydrolase family 2 TIM barrel-domain containing protein [Winogradskyella aquimaris]MDY2585799.1 glycoside hydrolase family 2 TIM barrel-domain containing protein [Winogradskyella aquimaris]